MIHSKHIFGAVKGVSAGLFKPTRLSGGMLIVIVYSVMMFGFLHGASLGYTADSVQETQIERSDMPVMTPEDFRNAEPTPTQQRIEYVVGADIYTQSGEPNWLQRAMTQQLVTMMNNLLGVVVVVSNAAGSFFYHNQWIPEGVVTGFAQGSQLLVIGGVFAAQAQRIVGLWSQR